MKIRNMLRGIPLLLFMMLGLSVFLNCGGLHRNPMPVPVASHTVTFDAQGGTPKPNPVQVEHGKKVAKPADPAKDSFIFGGWYKEKEYKTPWNFQTDTVTANITLYAKWNEKGATV